MRYDQNDISHLLSVLRTGRQNAQTAGAIEILLHRNFNFPISGNQVQMRGLITYAISNGHLIKSSTANPAGYWLENDPVEIRRYIVSLRRRAGRILQRAQNLEDNI